MNILIFGGAGYLGSMLTQQLLNRSLKVTVIDNLLYNQYPFVHQVLNNPNCTFIKTDIMAAPQEVISHADVIYNLAAWVGAPKCESDKKEATRVNAEAVSHLIKRLSKQQKLIYPCTNSGYGSNDDICTETTPLNSLSTYGKTKEIGEKWAMEHQNTIVFRLATVWGPSIRPRIDLMVNHLTYLAVKYNNIDLFQGNYKRNFVFIQDVIDILDQSKTNAKLTNEIFNLGCDEDNMTKNELVQKIKNYLPTTKISISQEEDPDKRNYNVSSAKLKEVGYEAKTTINKNLKCLINYYKNLGNGYSIINYMKNI